MLHENILGINDNVEPESTDIRRQRRTLNLSEESATSAESDDYVRDAFHIFHQIGALKYYDGNYALDPEKAKGDQAKWKDTRFAVVSEKQNFQVLVKKVVAHQLW